MTEDVRGAVAGGVAGFAATVPQTLTLELAHWVLPPGERRPIPPRRVTMRAAEAVGVREHESPEPAKVALTTAAHFGFGTATGAVYGWLAPSLPQAPVTTGIAYGLAVWAVAYGFGLPAAGLHPPETEEPAGRVAAKIAAHIAWGAALGVLTHQLLRGTRRPGD